MTTAQFFALAFLLAAICARTAPSYKSFSPALRAWSEVFCFLFAVIVWALVQLLTIFFS